jgi:hypothetical protein
MWADASLNIENPPPTASMVGIFVWDLVSFIGFTHTIYHS